MWAPRRAPATSSTRGETQSTTFQVQRPAAGPDALCAGLHAAQGRVGSGGGDVHDVAVGALHEADGGRRLRPRAGHRVDDDPGGGLLLRSASAARAGARTCWTPARCCGNDYETPGAASRTGGLRADLDPVRRRVAAPRDVVDAGRGRADCRPAATRRARRRSTARTAVHVDADQQRRGVLAVCRARAGRARTWSSTGEIQGTSYLVKSLPAGQRSTSRSGPRPTGSGTARPRPS